MDKVKDINLNTSILFLGLKKQNKKQKNIT